MKINVIDGDFEAYVAQPDVFGAPAIVVIQEIFGVNADVRQTCDELAAKGFIAIAPDLFWRQAPGLDLNSWSEAEWKQGLELYQAFDFDLGVADVAATLDAARNLDGSSGRVGVMGFCLGGLMTFLTAARTSVDAAVAYYGGNTDQYLKEADQINAHLMMHLGEDDEFISTKSQDLIKEALSDKSNIEIFTYPGCSHAFARHTGAHYDPVAAMLANSRTVEFLNKYLRSPT